MTYEKPTIKQELVNFFRNSDIISITERGVTTETDTGTFSATLSHELSVTPTKLKNIRSIVISSESLKYGQDYSFDFKTGNIYFIEEQTGDYIISYDVGTTDKIYPDLPRDDLTLTSYPRISIIVLSDTEDAYGIGGNAFITETLFSIIIYSESQDFIEEKIKLIKEKLRNGAKSFNASPFVKPTGKGPIIKSEDRHQTLLQCNVDGLAMFEVSTI